MIANFILGGWPGGRRPASSWAQRSSQINGQPIDDVVNDAVIYSAPFSTDHVYRLQKLRYAIRFPLGR